MSTSSKIHNNTLEQTNDLVCKWLSLAPTEKVWPHCPDCKYALNSFTFLEQWNRNTSY